MTITSIRADFARREVVLPGSVPWVPSPSSGVERSMLDRIGGEDGRATSIVRYAPNAVFPRHAHPGGEEFLVLDGRFIDEHGEYPVGAYVRNPVGSSHAPHAGPEGATLFVKLHQFAAGDGRRVVVDTSSSVWRPGTAVGLSVLPLHTFGEEHVALVRWEPDTTFHRHSHWGGEEIVVLEGVFHDEFGAYPVGSWLRSPHLSTHTPFTKSEGAIIFVKVGHLGGHPSA